MNQILIGKFISSERKRKGNETDFETLKRAIDESVKEKDEYNLPGLGVFLELIWENASTEMKNELIEIIRKRVKKGLAKDES